MKTLLFVSVLWIASARASKQLDASTPWPFPYDWSKFPAAWFGANATNWESEAQIAEIGRYSMAIFGWQHLTMVTDFTAVVYEQITQAAILKNKHPDLPVFVYCGFGWGMGLNAGVLPIMKDPDYKDFWLQASDGPVFTQTDCQQGHTSPGATDGRCLGYFWNFNNASARDYFLEKLIAPLAAAGPIDGVFFDATNYGYDIPEVHPWNKHTINVPNCTFPNASDYSGCEALVAGTIEVAKRTAIMLNKNGKVPMFANPGTFVQPTRQHIWLNESRLVDALAGTAWMTYYESARAEQAMTTGYYSNMLTEQKLGVAAGVHTYYKNATEDPLPHIAAFMLAQEEHWYYFGSTGWWDDSFTWSPLYDNVTKCGKPSGAATQSGPAASPIYKRDFEHCKVALDCTQADFCRGSIDWSA